MYFYRKLIEPAVAGEGASTGAAGSKAQPKTLKGAAGQIVGLGPLAPTGRFIVGFGFVFLTLSLLEGAMPELAGYFALLVALTAILGNGAAVAKDISTQLAAKSQGAPAKPSTAKP